MATRRTVAENTNNRSVSDPTDDDEKLRGVGRDKEFPYTFPIYFDDSDEFTYRTVQDV